MGALVNYHAALGLWDWVAIGGFATCVAGYGYIIGTFLHDWALSRIEEDEDA